MIYKLIFGNGYNNEPTEKIELKKPWPIVGSNLQFTYLKGDEEGKTSNEFNLTLKVISTDEIEISSQPITFMVGLEAHRSQEKPTISILNKEAINDYFESRLDQAEIYGHRIRENNQRIKIVWEEANNK